jgi:hypothetical protein
MDGHDLLLEAIDALLAADLTNEPADWMLDRIREFSHDLEDRLQVFEDSLLKVNPSEPRSGANASSSGDKVQCRWPLHGERTR